MPTTWKKAQRWPEVSCRAPICPPTIYKAEPDDERAREEIFGPVLSVITVQSLEEAIEVANDTPYGLSASLFTSHARNALTTARAIRAGTVTVNCYGEGDITTPFGGYKQSGFGGRDNGLHAHDQYTELKTIWIDLSDPASQRHDRIAEMEQVPAQSEPRGRRGGRGARRELRSTFNTTMLPVLETQRAAGRTDGCRADRQDRQRIDGNSGRRRCGVPGPG